MSLSFSHTLCCNDLKLFYLQILEYEIYFPKYTHNDICLYIHMSQKFLRNKNLAELQSVKLQMRWTV